MLSNITDIIVHIISCLRLRSTNYGFAHVEVQVDFVTYSKCSILYLFLLAAVVAAFTITTALPLNC